MPISPTLTDGARNNSELRLATGINGSQRQPSIGGFVPTATSVSPYWGNSLAVPNCLELRSTELKSALRSVRKDGFERIYVPRDQAHGIVI